MVTEDLALRAAQLCKGEIKLDQFVSMIAAYERDRIRMALHHPCGQTISTTPLKVCLLPEGHVGGHFWAQEDFDPEVDGPRIPVTRARLDEVLSG